MMEIRRMEIGDLDGVVRLQGEAYGAELMESREVLVSKLRVGPATSFVVVNGSEMAAYVLAHPYYGGESPGLGAEFESLAAMEEEGELAVVHLHDLAVGKAYGGRGLARRLVTEVVEASRTSGFGEVTLVAVQDARGFWEKMGFKVVGPAAGYDEEAVFMRRAIG